jgi:hypothetical protein
MTTNFNLDEILNKVEQNLNKSESKNSMSFDDAINELDILDDKRDNGLRSSGLRSSSSRGRGLRGGSSRETGGSNRLRDTDTNSNTVSAFNKKINISSDYVEIPKERWKSVDSKAYIKCIYNDGSTFQGRIKSIIGDVITISRYNIYIKRITEKTSNFNDIKQMFELKKDNITNTTHESNTTHEPNTTQKNMIGGATTHSPASNVIESTTVGNEYNSSELNSNILHTDTKKDPRYDMLLSEMGKKLLHFDVLEKRIEENEKNLEKLFGELKKVYSMVKNLYKALADNHVISLE